MMIEDLNEQHFNTQLSPIVMDLLADLSSQRLEVQAFVERMFKFMKTAHFQATDFSHFLARAVRSILPRILPGAWSGMIPPLTLEGRHQKIDEYISLNPWFNVGSEGTLLDIGCGFPPVTTVETAEHFTKWKVIGADPSFPYYMVYDEIGDYAFFNYKGEIQYFQAGIPNIDRWDKLLCVPEATRTYFTGLLHLLLANLPESSSEELISVEKRGIRLIKNPLKHYERTNISFLREGIEKLDIQNVDIIRCFNVLFYFDRTFRNRSLLRFAEILKNGGLFLCGANWFKSIECRYTVYCNEEKHLVEKEFAFSIDNIRPTWSLVPWYALHDDDYETCLLTNAVAVIRSDSEFRCDFDRRFDALLSEFGLFSRDKDGYLSDLNPKISSEEQQKYAVEINNKLDREGYVERAVSVLKYAGIDAWRNCVGHISLASGTFHGLDCALKVDNQLS